MDISLKVGKSFTLIVKVLSSLVADKLIEENGLAPSSGGRRPVLYQLKQDSFYIIAVAMDQFITRISLLNAARVQVITPISFELNLHEHDSPLQFLTGQIKTVSQNRGIDPKRILGIGIGMPGFINPEKGINHTFMGAGIRDYIQKETGLPVFIENDSSVIALAEYTFGKAGGVQHSMIVNLGWGIGLGMIISGQLFRGESGFAGEFSHISLFKNGKLCSCGKTGCLETESSLTYMLGRAAEKLAAGQATCLKNTVMHSDDHQLKSEAFLKAVAKGDSLAMEILSEAGYNIGRGIAILIHLLNPAKIILSGRCAEPGQVWLPPIWQALNTFCIPTLLENTKIEVSAMHKNAGLVGASVLVIEQIAPEDIQSMLDQSKQRAQVP
ncbi:Sugar kinase of the NBD/HSP70 family, may contain an N-terminal HTH domain [Arachidicoccus rhizosphaerae]|uniref:Sugar kinase of the NBD/HSP70 family, may contain an N-terminal HTH domain n=1 Tax=Arachidicoccus rhizosphaerae TaxID=551991 RepID=A0A1H4ACE9_9BACT|nr:ROK family protein [Arachidicoccus rhizosphaerae]SEA33580.1 Sugar kinase of the NBD/HSP70 family, may contain an N-terminal HTH domain [Arachidicoccus rhizosphaerae]